MITERQTKLLFHIVKEYINTIEPVSSFDLKKVARLPESAATVRNDLQELTKRGFIIQPHTSAGRIPTKKAYKFFAERCQKEKGRCFESFIVRQITITKVEIEKEMDDMQKIINALENNNLFEILNILETWHKKII